VDERSTAGYERHLPSLGVRLCKDIDERVHASEAPAHLAIGPTSGSTLPTSRCARAGGSSASPR
jgi:hypothetical protein